MATHKLSILVEAIGTSKASKQLQGVDRSISNIGAHAGRGARTAIGNVARIGAVAAGGIALAVHSGLQSLAELENATSAVDGAIKQVGLTGQVTAAQVTGWANEIEAATGAAFDDKDIANASANLIRYGKVVPANLRPAMEVMTDLAARVGSVDTAGELLAKALADPTKAAGKLSRYGIVLTKQQEKQIKEMVKAGDTAGAQALLLDELAKSTEGAAAASQGPYQRALSVLSDTSEDARRALAEGFLPVITKVADLLQTELAKPSTMANIREFGNTLASGLDDLVDIARNMPWATIGDSLRIAGGGAKAVLTAFSSLPPWVQTAVITGWGLDKLSGGALGSIVGELGKGLIKGVLGMTAGVVNIKAGVVNGAGGVGGAGGAAGGMGKLGKALAGASIIGDIAGVIATQQAVSGQSTAQATEIKAGLDSSIAGKSLGELNTALGGVEQGIRDLQSNPLNALVQGDALTTLQQMQTDLKAAIAAKNSPAAKGVPSAVAHSAAPGKSDKGEQKLSDIIASTKSVKSQVISSGKLQQIAQMDTKRETAASASKVSSTTRSATAAGASLVASAVRSSRPIITTNVSVSVGVGSVTKKVTQQKRVGKPYGSGEHQAPKDIW